MILVWQIPRQDDFFDNWDSQARQSGQSEHSAIQIAYKQMGLSENLGYIYIPVYHQIATLMGHMDTYGDKPLSN
jgi:hypothetical protein